MNEDVNITIKKEKCPYCKNKFLTTKTHRYFVVYTENNIEIKDKCPYCNNEIKHSIKGCENIIVSPIIKLKKYLKYLIWIWKFIWIIVSPILLMFYPNFNFIKINEKMKEIIVNSSFITSLFPMIISVVTIALSLGDNTIYSISSFKFRRLRNGFYFSFLNMIIISILILAFETYSKILDSYASLVWLNVISIMYSIMFAIQEIPILTKKDDYLMKIVKNADIDSEKTKEGGDSLSSDYDNVLTHLILNKGISQTFRDLSKEYSYQKGELLNRLLNLINVKLTDYLKNAQKIENCNNISEYSNIINEIQIYTNELVKFFNDYDNLAGKVNIEKYNVLNSIVQISNNLESLSNILHLEKDFKIAFDEILKSLMDDELDGGENDE